MTDHPHIGVFQSAMAAFSAGDMDALAEVFHSDVATHPCESCCPGGTDQ